MPVLVRVLLSRRGFFGGQSRFDPADNACQNKIERGLRNKGITQKRRYYFRERVRLPFAFARA
jgi:hypothetical protein